MRRMEVTLRHDEDRFCQYGSRTWDMRIFEVQPGLFPRLPQTQCSACGKEPVVVHVQVRDSQAGGRGE